MKIRISENQFSRLFNEEVNFDGGDIKEFPPSEVTTTAIIDDEDGEEFEYGHLPTADKVSKELPDNVPFGWHKRRGVGFYY